MFLTGSNSYLLSDEISTKLTGRYLNFEVYALDFKEYLDMKKYYNLNIEQDIYAEFNEYVLNGGFPKTLEFPDVSTRQVYTRGIIGEIFEKDVKTRKRISNIAVYERVQSFILNNYASPFSITNLMESLREEGFSMKPSTVRGYIENLKKAKIVYECNRFVPGKRNHIVSPQEPLAVDGTAAASVHSKWWKFLRTFPRIGGCYETKEIYFINDFISLLYGRHEYFTIR